MGRKAKYYVTERSGMIYDICALCVRVCYGPEGRLIYDICALCVRVLVLCVIYVYGPEGN